MRILVVEDDPSISVPLAEGLRREGFEVEVAPTGAAALAAQPVDIVLLDLGLPDLEGNVVCQRMRARSAVPIIVVTARGEEIDRVVLLELGADDYVVKPFGLRELVARIRAVLRRTAGAAPGAAVVGEVVVGPLCIDPRTRAVTLDGAAIALTPKEYDLLLFLAADPGAVRGRDELIREVWDEHWWGSTKTLDVHVASLRKKLRPELIETVRSVGYRIVDLSAVEQ
ncbi:MAG: response regulator transcription factor [Actinomycetota bacterium]|nr:response regulator transcription factor [Actinomycetota bacterium]